MGVSDEILYLNVTNAIDVQFSGWGRINARKALLDAGALEKFTSRAWVDNHYRWIVWKIACMIRSYPIKFNHWWCREKVVDQLLYRYTSIRKNFTSLILFPGMSAKSTLAIGRCSSGSMNTMIRLQNTWFLSLQPLPSSMLQRKPIKVLYQWVCITLLC